MNELAPLPGRADWGPAQPPADSYRTYNEPPQDIGMSPKNLKDAEGAIAMAMRFQGMRGFQDDLASGVAPDQALLKNAQKIFFNAPSALGAAVGRIANIPPPFTPGPVQAQPVLHPVTKQPIRGLYSAPSKGGAVNIGAIPGEGVPKADNYARNFKLSRLGKEIDELNKAVLGATKTQKVGVQAALDAKRAEAEALLGPKTKTLTKELARQFFDQANGDRETARKLARDAGFEF